MKTIFAMLLIFSVTPFVFGQNKDIDALKQLNKDWIGSFVTRDTAMMARIYADDMILVSPSGRVFHKKDLLRNLLSPEMEFVSSKWIRSASACWVRWAW